MRARLKADDTEFAQELSLAGVAMDFATVPWYVDHVLCVGWVERHIRAYDSTLSTLDTQ